MSRLPLLFALCLPLVLVGCSSGPLVKSPDPEVVASDSAGSESEPVQEVEPREQRSDSATEQAPAKQAQEKTELQSSIELSLTPAQLNWVGGQIYLNECAGQFRCLVHWNDGEAFPSLGIGHFIWYPEDVSGPFVESFPALVAYLQEQQVRVPDWLDGLEPMAAPWPDRAAFLKAEGSGRVQGLRDFLSQTRGEQVRFIFQRAKTSLDDVVQAAPAGDRKRVRSHLEALVATPGGAYAVIDYVNFKGEGLAATERYQEEGWGLLQVLQAMEQEPGRSALDAFREAAGQVLTRRAENATNPIERERWLRGWLVRLETYREPPQAPLL